MKKTAWIFPGGSARGVYTAGALYALCEMDIERPDIIIGSSGSAPTCLCYVTGQKEVIQNVWLGLLSTREFVNFLRFWKVVDVDYLIDVAIRERNTLDMETVSNSPITVYFPLTNSMTGEIKYMSNRSGLDLWKVVKAAVSVPIWTNLFSVMGEKINGIYYSDSPPGARFQLHVEKVIQEGAKRIIVFDNWHDSDNPTGFFFTKFFAYMRNSQFRRNQLRYFREIENFSIPKGIEFVRLAPRQKLSMSRFENNNDFARGIFDMGYTDTLQDAKLSKFRRIG